MFSSRLIRITECIFEKHTCQFFNCNLRKSETLRKGRHFIFYWYYLLVNDHKIFSFGSVFCAYPIGVCLYNGRLTKITIFIKIKVEAVWYASCSEASGCNWLCDMCPNTEFFLVRILLYSDQKKLCLWTIFKHWFFW